jgi:hypothetical protein
MSVTIMELAEHRLGREARFGSDFEEAGLSIMGGCAVCGATLGAFNGCPSKSGYWKCASGCIADDGYATVEEANAALFGKRAS